MGSHDSVMYEITWQSFLDFVVHKPYSWLTQRIL
jgi:hypothetical protein